MGRGEEMSRNPLYERQAERRKIAAQVLTGLKSDPSREGTPKQYAVEAIDAAEALIAELDRREAAEVEAGNVEEPTR